MVRVEVEARLGVLPFLFVDIDSYVSKGFFFFAIPLVQFWELVILLGILFRGDKCLREFASCCGFFPTGKFIHV